jgi:hypothetical protein
MDCKACRNEIDLSPAGGGERAAQARAHIRSCARCREFSAERRALSELVSSIEAVSAPDDFEWRLRARINADKRGDHVRQSFRPGFAPGTQAIALAASFALLLGVAVIFKQTNTEELRATPAGEVAAGNARQIVKTPGEETAPLPETKVLSNNKRTNTTSSFVNSRVRSTIPARVASEAKERLAPAAVASVHDSTVRSNDFSSTAAPVITLFAVPVKDPSQHLKLMLDEGHGATRTVSLQPVTFGTQSILERQGGASVQRSAVSNADGIW